MDNYLQAQSMFRRRNEEKWKEVGRQIDIYARFLVPSCYVSILVWLFVIDLQDPYADDGVQSRKSFRGIHKIDLSVPGLVRTLILPLLMVLFVAFRVYASTPAAIDRPSVQQLRNRASELARSRVPEWLARVLEAHETPPEMHRFVSSAEFQRVEIHALTPR